MDSRGSGRRAGSGAGETFCRVYDVSAEGNFEHGKSILNRPKTLEQCAAVLGRDRDELDRELAEDRAKLLAVRDGACTPAWTTKCWWLGTG